MDVRRGVAAVIGAILLAGPVAAQRGDSASVRNAVVGQVIDSQNGKPVVGVLVSVSGPSREVATDANGRFVLQNLPDEPFTIYAAGNRLGGLATGNGILGQTHWAGEPQYISVKTGQVLRDVIVPFWRDGVIAGRVTDEAGTPIPGARIEIFHAGAQAGWRQLLQTEDERENPVFTDDGGVFRVIHSPGLVFLRVSSTELRAPEREIADRVEAMVFPSVYAPAATSIAGAQPILLMPGTEVTMDVTLRQQEGLAVSGVVEDENGPVADALVGLVKEVDARREAFWGRDLSTLAVTDRHGRFVIHAVASGGYLLKVEEQLNRDVNNRRPKTALRRLTVADRAIETVVPIRPQPRLSGRFVWAGSTEPVVERTMPPTLNAWDPNESRGWEKIRVIREEPSQSKFVPAPTTFELLADLGRQVLELEDLPDGWMLRSITLGDRDVTGSAFDVTGDICNLVVTLTDQVTELRGHITPRPGTSNLDTLLWVFPADASKWVGYGPWPARIPSVGVDNDGHFTLKGLLAGDYFALAIPARYWGRQDNATQLKTASRFATRFSIAEGERVHLELAVVALPSETEIPWALDDLPEIPAEPATLVERMGPDKRFATGGGTVRGRIVSADNGQPLANVIVTLEPWLSSEAAPTDDPLNDWGSRVWISSERVRIARLATVTNGTGEFALRSDTDGRFIIRARGASLVETRFPVLEPSDEVQPIVIKTGAPVAPIEIAMQRAATLSGVVLDEQGRPVVKARVVLTRANGSAWSGSGGNLFLATDDLGRYSFSGLSPGQYDLSVDAARGGDPVASAEALAQPLKTFVARVTDAAEAGAPDLILRAGEFKTIDFKLKLCCREWKPGDPFRREIR